METSNSDYTIFIGTTGVGGFIQPITNLTEPYLKTFPSAVKNYAGSHLGNGVYIFTKPDDGRYKVYESISGSEIASWGGVNGRWIGDDVLDYYGTSAQVASLQTEVDNLESATAALGSSTAAIVTQLANYAVLTGANTFTARQTLNGGITISGANSYLWAPFNLKTWAVCDVPLYATSVVPRSYVDSEIDTKLGSFSTSGYQESRNIIRLIPNGTEQTGKVYTSYSAADTYAYSTASSTAQMTTLICGNGINATAIIPTKFSDYVHIKGLGSNVRLDISGLTLSASVLGRIIIENITFVETEGSAGQNLENLIFKNCNFEEINNSTVFTTCRFIGLNYYSTDTDNTYQFQNSEGTIATDEHTVVVAGTSKVNILAPDKLTINTITLQDDGTQFYINSGLKIDQGATIGGETKISGRLNVTGDAKFVSNTIALSAANISLSGVVNSITANSISANYCSADGYVGVTDTITIVDQIGATHNIEVKNGLITSYAVS